MQKITIRWVLIFIWDISPNNELYLLTPGKRDSSCYSCGEQKRHIMVLARFILWRAASACRKIWFFRHQGSRTGWWWWLWPSRSFGTQPRKQPFSSDFTQTGILGWALTVPGFLEMVLLEHDALLWWHVQLFNVLTFYLVADCNKPCTRDCPQVCGSNGKTFCNKCILENVSFSRKWKN